jgi:hypothetical protein
MQAIGETVTVSKGKLWAGRAVSGLAVLFLLFDGVIKLMRVAPVLESFAQLGYPASLAVAIGTIELICVVFYVVPRTSILGAVLVTGLLGGAISTHLRVGDPLFSHVLFPVYLGVLVWGGIWLRDDALRELVPLRRRRKS